MATSLLAGPRRFVPRAGLLLPILAALVLLAVATVSFAADLRFDWQDRFSAAERARLERWVRDTHSGVEQVLGPLPRGLRVEMRRSTASREPVPWARTLRAQPQGVRFHVNPESSDTALRQDWTAAHELSHLALPYLDGEGAWFAEGFASAMQYPVMAATGAIPPASVAARIRRHLDQAQADNPYPGRPYLLAVDDLARRGYYSVMYWGGAAYFLRVNAVLQARGSSLQAVLRRYLACCRQDYDELDSLIDQLDTLAGTDVFRAQRERLLRERGFPVGP